MDAAFEPVIQGACLLQCHQLPCHADQRGADNQGRLRLAEPRQEELVGTGRPRQALTVDIQLEIDAVDVQVAVVRVVDPQIDLEALAAGEVTVEAALEALRGAWAENLGHTRIDGHRTLRDARTRRRHRKCPACN